MVEPLYNNLLSPTRVKDEAFTLATFIINNLSGVRITPDADKGIVIDVSKSFSKLFNIENKNIDLKLLDKASFLVRNAFEEYNLQSKMQLTLTYDAAKPTIFQTNRPIHHSDVESLMKYVLSNLPQNDNCQTATGRKKFAIAQIQSIEL